MPLTLSNPKALVEIQKDDSHYRGNAAWNFDRCVTKNTGNGDDYHKLAAGHGLHF